MQPEADVQQHGRRDEPGDAFGHIATFLIEQTGISRTEAATGAVTLIQRFGSAANLNIHLYALVLDGVYRHGNVNTAGTPEESTPVPAPVFHSADAPTHAALHGLLGKIIARIFRLLIRLGHLIEEEVLVHAEIRPLQAKTAASDGQFTLIPYLFESLHERTRIGGVMEC